MKHLFTVCLVIAALFSLAAAGCNGGTSSSGNGNTGETVRGIADPDFPDEPQHPSKDVDGMVVYYTNIYLNDDRKRDHGTMVLFTKKHKDAAFDIGKKKGKKCGIKCISRNKMGALIEYFRDTGFLSFPEGPDHLFTPVSPLAREEVWINQFKIVTDQRTWVKPLSEIRKRGAVPDREKELLFDHVRKVVMAFVNSGTGGTAIIDPSNISIEIDNKRR